MSDGNGVNACIATPYNEVTAVVVVVVVVVMLVAVVVVTV